jgi:recombination protein RecA
MKKTTVEPAVQQLENAGKDKAISVAIEQITKQFGEGAIMRMTDKVTKPIDVISTGAISLDIALGTGGVPRGRIIEIYGPESSGKTTLALHIVAEAQKGGHIAAFIDAEHALDTEYAKRIGVNMENLLISQPDYGEQALEILEMLLRSGSVDVIVVDSVAALTPKAEIEGDMGDSHMGLQARLMSQALRKITGIASKTNTTVIFLNQLRMKIGVMFGNPETTTGGNALKFYASVRIDIRRSEKITVGEELVGHVIKAKVVKNKIAPPFREAQFDMIHGLGFDKISSLMDAALQFGVLEKAGSWYKYKAANLAQGKDGTKEILKNDQALLKDIYKQVKEKAGIR